MKDNYASTDLDDLAQINGFSLSTTGMRHSIRPRRMVLQQAQKRAIAEAPETLYESRFVRDPETPRWKDLNIQAPMAADHLIGLSVHEGLSEEETAAARAFDLLRTRLRQTTLEHGWTNIAITAPTSGCGNTFTTVNLALSLSRVPGSRTLLMDMNMRKPGLAQAFGMPAPGPIREMLAGRTAIGHQLVRASETLALGLNGTAEAEPSEILQDASTGSTLARIRAALRPELVIYDMPAMLAYDDVTAFLPQLDGVLLVSDGTRTMSRQLKECERMLDGQVPLMGVVLNRARPSSVKRYH